MTEVTQKKMQIENMKEVVIEEVVDRTWKEMEEMV